MEMLSHEGVCAQAVAYIKDDLPAERDYLFKLGQKDEPVSISLGNGLKICFLIERGNRFEFVQNKQLREENLSKDQILAMGLRNLGKKALKNLRIRKIKDVFSVYMDDNFEASLMLIDELWERTFQPYIKNQYVVAIPARNMLIFCDKTSDMGILELQRICNRVRKDREQLLSENLFIRESSGWVVIL